MRRAMILCGALVGALLPVSAMAQDQGCDLGLSASPTVGLYGDIITIDAAHGVEIGDDAQVLGAVIVEGPDGEVIDNDEIDFVFSGVYAGGLPIQLSVPPSFGADDQLIGGEFSVTVFGGGCTGQTSFGQTLDLEWTLMTLPDIANDLVPSDIAVGPDGTIILSGNTQIEDPDGNLLPPVPTTLWSPSADLPFERSDGFTLEGAFLTNLDWDASEGNFLGSGTSFDASGAPMPFTVRTWDGSLFGADASSLPPTIATFVQIPTSDGIAHVGVGEDRLPRDMRRRTGEQGNVFYGEYYGPAADALGSFFTTRISKRPTTPLDGIIERDGMMRVAQWNGFAANGNGLELYASDDDGMTFSRTGTPKDRKAVPRQLAEGAGFTWLTTNGGPAWRSKDGERWARVGPLGADFGGALAGVGVELGGVLVLDSGGGAMTWNGREFYAIRRTAFDGYRLKSVQRLPDGRWAVVGENAMPETGAGMAAWVGRPVLAGVDAVESDSP